ARARFPRSAVPDLTESASFRSEDQAAVRAVPLHADSLVDPDRRRVLRTHEQAHRRDALQKQTAEVAHAAFGIALVPLRRVDPDLLHLHGRRRPRRRLRLEPNRAVLDPEPGPPLPDLRAGAPAETVRVPRERVDADLLLVRSGGRRQ